VHPLAGLVHAPNHRTTPTKKIGKFLDIGKKSGPIMPSALFIDQKPQAGNEQEQFHL
jgi:hypothetical protein